MVTAVQHGTIIRGTATKLRLLLDYNEAGHQHRLPPTMWFKGGLEDHSLTDDMLIVYAGEAAFFNEVAATLAMDIPKAVVAAIDPATNRSFLLLDDLLSRNASFGTAIRPLSPADASVLVEELANLHAAYWLSPKLKTMDWLGGGGSLLQSCEVATPCIAAHGPCACRSGNAKTYAARSPNAPSRRSRICKPWLRGVERGIGAKQAPR
jgi:hypothetical protein